MVLDEEFPPDDRVYKEAQSLITAGFKVSIACYTFIKNKPEFESFEGISIYRKVIPKLIYKSSVAALKVPIYFNWWIKYIKIILAKETFDILHIHDLPLAKVGVYFKEHYNLKLVIDLHENWPAYLEKAIHVRTFLGRILSSNTQWRNYEAKILKKGDLIITVVDEMSNRLEKLGISKSKMTVIQNTNYIDRYPDFGNSPESNHFTLFYAGDIARVRGIQTILDDLQNLIINIKGLRVWIIGKGNFLDDLKNLVNQKGLNNIFTFFGWQPLTEIMKLLEKADIGLMPFLRWEQIDCSSPNKLFQYMLKNKPALCNNADSINRIINETKSGLIYDCNVEGDFKEKLLWLYKNQEEMKKMGVQGRKWVEKKYNWDYFANDLVDSYNNL